MIQDSVVTCQRLFTGNQLVSNNLHPITGVSKVFWFIYTSKDYHVNFAEEQNNTFLGIFEKT